MAYETAQQPESANAAQRSTAILDAQQAEPTSINAATANGSSYAHPIDPGSSTGSTKETTSNTIQSARAIIDATLAGIGLGGMSNWANGYAATLAGQGMASGDIENQILANLNNPVDSNGKVDTGALNAFNAAMPGFNQRIANGYGNGSPGSSSVQAIAQFVTYQTQLKETASQVGITLDASQIGQQWADDKSADEVSTRLTQGYAAAMAAPQEVRDHLQQQYGISPADLATYYLNPETSLTQLQQQFNSASVGAAAQAAGFDGQLSTARSQALSTFLASSNNSGMGGAGSVNEAQGVNALTGSLGSSTAPGTQLGSAAALVQGGYEAALPGHEAASPGVLSEDQILGAVEGNASSVAAVDRATQTRTAGSKGGGGAVTTAQGASGLGFAAS